MILREISPKPCRAAFGGKIYIKKENFGKYGAESERLDFFDGLCMIKKSASGELPFMERGDCSNDQSARGAGALPGGGKISCGDAREIYTGGKKMRHVAVTEFDPAWAGRYAAEAAVVQKILGENCTAVYHIGSTAVPGLAAKPIVDILPVVRDIAAVDAENPRFEAAGYEAMGEYGIPGRRYFRKGWGGDETVHVHVFGQSSAGEIRRHLAVRDFLRTHPADAAAYGELKIRLARQFPWDIEAYCGGKDAFVKELERRALAWASQSAGRGEA